MFEHLPLLRDVAQLWIFLLTWALAEAFLFVAVRVALRYNLTDKPDFKRKIHETPIPTIGGVPIFMAFVLGIALTQEGWGDMRIPLMGAFICMLLGLIDDFKPIYAVVKLIVLFLVTLFIFSSSNITVNLTSYDALNILLSLFWIVGMMSAINSLDNMDGLVAGTTAISSTFIFIIAWEHWDRWLSFMAVGLCAGCLTFLKYNFFQKRAGIFLGDNGSYFIGFTLACMVMMGAWTNPRVDYDQTERTIKALLIPPLLLGVPIFDIITATVLRLVNKEVKSVTQAIVYCGKDHTSHRLVALGFSRREAVLLLWGLSFALGVVSLVIQNSSSPKVYLALAAVTFGGLVVFAAILNKARVYEHQMLPMPPPSQTPPA